MKTLEECILATPMNTIGMGDVNPITTDPLPKYAHRLKLKSLKEYIKMCSKGIVKPKHSKYTNEELIEDYKRLTNTIDIDEKKEIADKYEVNSKKVLTIGEAILKELLKERWYKEDFNEDDITYYTKMNPPSQYAKLENFLKNENPLFCQTLLEQYYTILENNNLLEFIGNPSKEMTVIGKYLLKTYENMRKYLESIK